jgi:hypothetical protein
MFENKINHRDTDSRESGVINSQLRMGGTHKDTFPACRVSAALLILLLIQDYLKELLAYQTKNCSFFAH